MGIKGLPAQLTQVDLTSKIRGRLRPVKQSTGVWVEERNAVRWCTPQSAIGGQIGWYDIKDRTFLVTKPEKITA